MFCNRGKCLACLWHQECNCDIHFVILVAIFEAPMMHWEVYDSDVAKVVLHARFYKHCYYNNHHHFQHHYHYQSHYSPLFTPSTKFIFILFGNSCALTGFDQTYLFFSRKNLKSPDFENFWLTGPPPSHFTPEGGLGLTLGLVFACCLFIRGD